MVVTVKERKEFHMSGKEFCGQREVDNRCTSLGVIAPRTDRRTKEERMDRARKVAIDLISTHDTLHFLALFAHPRRGGTFGGRNE